MIGQSAGAQLGALAILVEAERERRHKVASVLVSSLSEYILSVLALMTHGRLQTLSTNLWAACTLTIRILQHPASSARLRTRLHMHANSIFTIVVWARSIPIYLNKKSEF